MAWTSTTRSEVKLGVIDFRTIPGVLQKEHSLVDKPFFYKVLTSMQKMKQSLLKEVKSWLFICTDEKDQAQVLTYVEKNEILKTFNMHCVDYYLTKNERLYDLPANNAKALKKVLLIFLQSPDNVYHTRIYSEFIAPDTPVYKEARRYNELPYRMYNIELKMEFYLWVVKKFYNPRSSVFSIFVGGKLTCAALVSC